MTEDQIKFVPIGVADVVKERLEQVFVAKYSPASDLRWDEEQLREVAMVLASPDHEMQFYIDHRMPPKNWDVVFWKKLLTKNYRERMVVAAALLSAEVDRIDYLNEMENNEH